jgi:hypothetical protein
MFTTYNKNEQEDTKNNAELQTKWRQRTGKIFEEIITRGRNRSVNV